MYALNIALTLKGALENTRGVSVRGWNRSEKFCRERDLYPAEIARNLDASFLYSGVLVRRNGTISITPEIYIGFRDQTIVLPTAEEDEFAYLKLRDQVVLSVTTYTERLLQSLQQSNYDEFYANVGPLAAEINDDPEKILQQAGRLAEEGSLELSQPLLERYFNSGPEMAWDEVPASDKFDMARAKYYYGLVKMGNQLFEEGRDAFEVAKRILDEPKVLTSIVKSPGLPDKISLALGNSEYRLGNQKKSLEWYEQVSPESPQFAESLRQIGKIHLIDGDVKAASLSLERAVKLDPRDVEAIASSVNWSSEPADFPTNWTAGERVSSTRISPSWERCQSSTATITSRSPTPHPD